VKLSLTSIHRQQQCHVCILSTAAGTIFLIYTVLTTYFVLYAGSGGAIYSANTVSMQSCVFLRNTASLNGGAVFSDVGSRAIMNGCILTNNSAAQSGAAWFGFGSDASMTHNNTLFRDNTASCCYANGYGSKLQTDAGDSSNTCTDTDSGRGGADCCYGTQYTNGNSCEVCLRGADCSILGSSLASQSLTIGFWRASDSTTDVRECWLKSACNGSSSSSSTQSTNTSTGLSIDVMQADNKYCATGYVGPCEYSTTACIAK
jgi:predicted outer membrane repeat protein